MMQEVSFRDAFIELLKGTFAIDSDGAYAKGWNKARSEIGVLDPHATHEDLILARAHFQRMLDEDRRTRIDTTVTPEDIQTLNNHMKKEHLTIVISIIGIALQLLLFATFVVFYLTGVTQSFAMANVGNTVAFVAIFLFLIVRSVNRAQQWRNVVETNRELHGHSDGFDNAVEKMLVDIDCALRQ